MGMVVKNNMSAVRTLNTLNSNTSALQKSLQKVSSGMKINSAQDDASGYAISERMRVRIRSLDQANQNSQNDSSLMKTAEGAVGNTVEILRALKEKAINAANDSNTDEDRQTIQKEINQFIDQIDDNALVQFNGKYLVDGSKNNAFFETKSILLNQSLQVGTTSASALTTLNNRAGDSLGIQTSDQYQVSWVQNGTVHFTSGRVAANAISDILTIKGQVKVTADDGTVSFTDGNISEVKATDKSGLISGSADLIEKEDMYASSFEYKPNDVTTAKPIIEAFEDYVSEAGVANTVAKNILELTKTVESEDKSVTETVPLFALSADGKEKIPDTATIQYDSTNQKYVINNLSSDGTTPVTVYQLSSSYKPDNDTTTYAYTDVLTYASGMSKTGTPFSGATNTKTDLTETNFTIPTDKVPEGATGAQWYVVDSTGKEITGVKVQSGTGGDSDKLYFYKSDGTTELSAGDKVQIKYIPKNDNVGENGLTDAWDKFGKEVYTPDKTEGIAFGSYTSGVNDQISGLTISILDQDGNVKKAANAALDQFKQYQRAENETGDMSLNFHIGSEANVSFKVGMGDMRAQALGLKGSDGTRIDVYTKEHANAAINVIENALTKALDQQTTIGAIEARLEYTSTNLTTSSENVQAAESTIRDADMAKEMTNYTKSNVLLQAAQAMLAQANQNSSAVLSLLQ